MSPIVENVPTPCESILHPTRASQVPYNAKTWCVGFEYVSYVFPIHPFKGLPIGPCLQEAIARIAGMILCVLLLLFATCLG